MAAAQRWYDAITVKLDKLTERVQTQKSIEKPTYQDLAELKAVIRQKNGASNDQIKNITTAINKVENWRIEWLKEYQQWTKWQETLLKSVSISSVELTFTQAHKLISEALDLIRENLEPLLVEIDRKFRQLEIEIPFPQSDLHLRSVDQSAALSLQPSGIKGTSAASDEKKN